MSDYTHCPVFFRELTEPRLRRFPGRVTPMRMVRLFSAITLLATSALAQSNPLHMEKAFQSNGQIRMQLGGGDYEVRAGSADKIVIEWTVKNEHDAAKVKTKLSIVGQSAKLETSGPHKDSHAVIEVPPETNLVIRLAAGDMKIRGILGDKDVASHAGDLDIYVGNANDYSRVDASVKVGDLDASAFGASKGGLFRSFHHQGNGKYVLRAHLGAGDLNLHQGLGISPIADLSNARKVTVK